VFSRLLSEAMDLNEEEISSGINLLEDWSTRAVLATARIKLVCGFDDEPMQLSECGASSSCHPLESRVGVAGLVVEPDGSSDSGSEGPLVLQGPSPTVGGESVDEAPVRMGDASHGGLATASDVDDVDMVDAGVQDDGDAGQVVSVGAGSWEPGWNAGIWVTSARPPAEQCQVLICNAYLVAKRLPKDLLHALAQFFDRKRTSLSLYESLPGSWA